MLCVMKGIFTSRPVATTLSIFRTNSSITGVLIELISRNSRNMLIVILIGLCENLKSIEWIWAEWWPWIELKRQPNASDLTHARYEAGYYRFHWSICVEKTHPLQRRAPPLISLHPTTTKLDMVDNQLVLTNLLEWRHDDVIVDRFLL